MTDDDLASEVERALQRSVVPIVIARGGSIRVIATDASEVVVEVTGSPGAVAPLMARMERQILAAVPAITSVRFTVPGDPRAEQHPSAGYRDRVQAVIDAAVNPTVAAHRGHVFVTDVEAGWIHVRLEGGCQGCSLAEVTLRQGIEPLLRGRFPEIVGIIDVTDHAAGTEPYFSPAKR